MKKVKFPSNRFIRFLSNKYIKGTLLVIAGFLLGVILFNHPGKNEKTEQVLVHEHSEAENTIWTCAMHPQIRMDRPGQCPICGMDLIPLQKSDTEIDDQAIEISESAMKLAEVQTSIVSRGEASKEVFLYGKIQPDEKLLQSQTAHIPGRIEKLSINVTGEMVKKDQLIARIYSPELITAQKELIEAMAISDKYPDVLEAAREKLRNWKLSDQQIKEIETSSSITSIFDIYSNTSGIVSSRKVNEGDYISKGAVLFDVMDLTKVWAVFDAYESDLPWISMGQKIEFTTQAIPGKSFNGKISFIDPVIDPVKRIARIRLEINNAGLQLKPDLFINGIIKSDKQNIGKELTIPQSAVLWTGPRSIVYVKIPGTEFPTFKMREITLGAAMKDSYIVIDGLQEGEEIVTNGTFSVDAAAQLSGKPSMMNQVGGTTSAMPGMIMPGDNDKSNLDAEDIESSGTLVKINVDMDFTMQINTLFDEYIALKNAFVQSDEKEIKQAAQKVQQSLSKVDMKLLAGDARVLWMNIIGILDKQIKEIASDSGIEDQRTAFSTFNKQFYKAVKSFGLMGKTVYYQFCPMANNSKGAYWLSETEDIRNPYYGAAMLTCGETRETLTY
jgi:Cu(I)/Ag(I) efflux system membrane fusion protein